MAHKPDFIGRKRLAADVMLATAMQLQDLIDIISCRAQSMLKDKGLPAEAIGPDRALLGDVGLDSLDLAGIVVELQELTGADPFEAGFVEFRTVRELAALFLRPE
jgi:acyl carrier protein